jgi:uncharacterized delta-60 repeat protein
MRLILAMLVLISTILIANSQPGKPDLTFNSGDIGNGQGDGFLSLSVFYVLDNNQIIAAGSFYNGSPVKPLVRLHPDGQLDTTFKLDPAIISLSVSSIAVQSDGRIIIGCSDGRHVSRDLGSVLRFNVDGSLDNSFDEGARLSGRADRIIVQPDDKVILAGLGFRYNNQSKGKLIRLNENGSLDTGFNQNIYKISTIGAVELQEDGKIIVGGELSPNQFDLEANIVRLQSNGQIDTSFLHGSGFKGKVTSLSVDDDQRMIVGGENLEYYQNVAIHSLVRLFPNGSLDTSFQYNPKFPWPWKQKILGAHKRQGGKLFVYGYFNSPYIFEFCEIIESNGAVDSTFSLDLLEGFNLSIETNDFYAVSQSDGKIILKKYYRPGPIRFHSNGLFDTTFNPVSGLNDNAYRIVLLKDQNVLISGDFNFYFNHHAPNLVLINSHGEFLKSLPTDTLGHTLSGISAINSETEVGGDGSFILETSKEGKRNLLRFLPDGSLDPSFMLKSGFDGSVYSVVSLINGKYLVAGSFKNYDNSGKNYLVRLNNDGSLDMSFSLDNQIMKEIYHAVIQADNKILIYVEVSSTSKLIYRLHPNGAIDNSWSTGTGFKSSSGSISIIVQPDGKVIAAGTFSEFNGYLRNNIVRLNKNGSIDLTFRIGTGFTSRVIKVRTQSNGKLVAIGDFFGYNNQAIRGIARLNPDGSLDQTFNPGKAFNRQVRDFVILNDGSFIAVGDFISYDGVGRNRIVKILNGWQVLEPSHGKIEHDSLLFVEDDLSGFNNLNLNYFDSGINFFGKSGKISSNADHFSVYPNPSSGDMYVNLGEEKERVIVEIYNFSGELVYSRSEVKTNKVLLQLNMSPGQYLLRVEADGTIKTMRYVLQ